MIIAGIDSDLSGGMACIDFSDGAPKILSLRRVPFIEYKSGKKNKKRLDNRGTDLILREFGDIGCATIAVERAIVRAQQGKGGFVNTAGIDTTHQTYGGLHALCEINFETVYPAWPQSWKKKMGLTKDKDLSLSMATGLHPSHASIFKLKKNVGLSEAVLLAHWVNNWCT